MLRRLLMTGLLVAAATSAVAAPGDRWLHIRVVESGPEGETVRVNFPLPMIEKIIPLVETRGLKAGRLRLDDGEMDAARLRAIWSAVREAPDGEFVTVESRREDVRVARVDGYIVIKVDEHCDGGDQVDIRVPLTVVDALLSGDGEEIDLSAALRALSDHGDGELVTVNDEESQVRIWVDSTQSGREGGRR